MTVYDCDHIIAQIENRMTEDGEISDENMKALVLAQTTSLVKLGKMCGYMKYLEHGINNCDEELARISAMKNKAKNRLASIKGYLTPYIKSKGKITIESFQLSTRKSESIKLIDGFDHKDWCNEKITLVPDKKKIKTALKNGKEIGGAELIVKDNLQLK